MLYVHNIFLGPDEIVSLSLAYEGKTADDRTANHMESSLSTDYEVTYSRDYYEQDDQNGQQAADAGQ